MTWQAGIVLFQPGVLNPLKLVVPGAPALVPQCLPRAMGGVPAPSSSQNTPPALPGPGTPTCPKERGGMAAPGGFWDWPRLPLGPQIPSRTPENPSVSQPGAEKGEQHTKHLIS